MIPVFPEFKKLEFKDRDDVQKLINHQHYSDFNFVSLYSYNTEDDMIISNLHGNLVARFRDYITNEPFYSFIGTNNLIDTTEKLLTHATSQNLKSELKLIPEISLPEEKEKFTITEDRDNFDYILDLEDISTTSGKKFANKRNLINNFSKNTPNHRIVELDLTNQNIQQEIIALFHEWTSIRNKTEEDSGHELIAIQRLLEKAKHLKLVAIGIYTENKLIGFAIGELLTQGHAIFHFVKGDTTYKGIFETLYHNIAKVMKSKGYTHFNIEQDLGIPGLRLSKEQWNPVKFLKKYIITPKD